MNIVMLITSLIIIAVCYWEAQSAAKPNKNIILGVMIPPLELSNMEVTKITKEFMYSIKILSVLAIVGYTDDIIKVLSNATGTDIAKKLYSFNR